MQLEEFRMRLAPDWLEPKRRCFRPPSWPPPRDWVVSEDRDGNVLSVWGDSYWDLSQLAGRSAILDFGDGTEVGRATPIDPANADLMRLVATWQMWGPRAVSSVNTLRAAFLPIRRVVAFCSQQGILASDLMRFPRVLEEVPGIISASEYKTMILEFHRLWDARDEIGFVLLDPLGIKRLAAVMPRHETVQTAYIPPRIWGYQLQRLQLCLDDFHTNRQAVEDCFNYCVDAYAKNYGSLRAALTTNVRSRLPFSKPKRENAGAKVGVRFHGRFESTAERFGIRSLLEEWVEIPAEGIEIRQLSSYLTLVQLAGLAYLTNFTLQRATEASSLRADCLVWEEDPKLGRVPIICGETTKTESDSDARWPTSPSVVVAVSAMSAVARLRIRCAAANPASKPSEEDLANPYLFDRAFEPWSGNLMKSYSLRPHLVAYAKYLAAQSKLFDREQLKITEEDLKIAQMMTPNLSLEKGFAIGQPWPFAWHQLRRTGAVNMFASGLLSDSSIQYQMKHSSRLMPLYYGRGYTKLLLNEEAETVVFSAMYEAMGRNLQAAMSERFVSPHGQERKDAIVVTLVGDKDAKQLSAAARQGRTFFREIRLGACTTRGTCVYGGIESVARCAGSDGGVACADALFDRTKAAGIQEDLGQIVEEIARVSPGTPRYQALLAERRGMENYLNVVRN